MEAGGGGVVSYCRAAGLTDCVSERKPPWSLVSQPPRAALTPGINGLRVHVEAEERYEHMM